MDTVRALVAIPELKVVEADLQVIQTMQTYVADKAPLKDAMLEVKTMSGWAPATIKASCGRVMDVLAEVFERIMTDFNEATEANVDSISLEPFTERFNEETKEQESLRAASLHVMEMASRVALALNIPVPASAPTSAVSVKPRKSFVKALKALVVEDASKSGSVLINAPMSWLTQAVLKEDDPSVQKLALLDSKLTQTKSADALRAFAARFMMADADMAEVILDVVDDARKQITQSDAISANVTADYNQKASVITALLDVRNAVTSTNSYVSGK